MIDFMCQLDGAPGVSRYFVKHFFGCVYVGVSGWD